MMTNCAFGVTAEQRACAALAADGWSILGRRLRTKAGEVDAVAEKDGLIAFVEVKARPTLAMAAAALGTRQQARLMASAEILLGQHPDWGKQGVRFDVMLVDRQSQVRRIARRVPPELIPMSFLAHRYRAPGWRAAAHQKPLRPSQP